MANSLNPEVLQLIQEKIDQRQTVLLCTGSPEMDLVLSQAVKACDATVITTGEDYRWKQLFRLAFTGRATVAIGSAEILLGLGKISRAWKIPLKVRCAIIVGGGCSQTIQEDIRICMDCSVLTEPYPKEQEQYRIAELETQLLQWTSVLDCRVGRSDAGVEIDMVTFDGEQLPKLPSCARLVLRTWEPEVDCPLSVMGSRVFKA